MEALLEADRFNITALTRSGSTGKDAFPDSVRAPVVDYEDPESLVAVLKGQDAVVSALSSDCAAQQQVLLDAAVSAGVTRFIPSEFGSDTLNANAAKLPVYSSKKKVQKQIEDLAAQGKISYTYVINGPFLDFGLEAGFLGLDLKKKQLTYLDGGNAEFSTTTRRTVGKVVVGVLSKPKETMDRAVYVQDVALTLKDLLRLSKQALGEDGWTEIDGGTSADVEKSSYEKLAQGQNDMGVFVGFLLSAFFREGYGGEFQKLDNEMFGISQMSDSDIVEVIREVARSLAA